MKEKADALQSFYLIDGVQKDCTPARLLDSVCSQPHGAGPSGQIVDEKPDPRYTGFDFVPSDIDSYLSAVISATPEIPLWDAGVHARKAIATTLMDTLWQDGHFYLDSLKLSAEWMWNPQPVGARAAFYDSVEAASDYLDALGISLSSYSYSETSENSSVIFRAGLSDSESMRDDVFQDPGSGQPLSMPGTRSLPATLVPDPKSWLVYIPFDPCDFRLGTSLLAQSLGLGGGPSVQISDADYFIDCYEVVRELAEDGILLSASTVCSGGLLKAADAMTGEEVGIHIDISDLMHSYGQKNPVKVLFSEVPGVLVQISDSDFDYLDAELLLQDVAFFPLGHPVPGNAGVRVKSSAKTGIQTILESLMQKAEGED